MDFSREKISGRVGAMRQVAAIRRAVLDDGPGRGMRIIDVSAGGGLSFTVYPDRGMDIGEASYKGMPLVWLTPGSATPESYEPEQFNWLRTWGGGLLTGCGLLNVGGPCEAGESHGLHGRLSHLKAVDVNTEREWDGAGNYRLTVSGKVSHRRVFGEDLLLTRRISTVLGGNTLEIVDTVENAGFRTTPYMQLYHMNFSWPLVDERSFLVAPEHPVMPQNDVAAAGLAQWDRMSAPTPGFVEQVFYHDLPADASGMAEMKLVSPTLKLAVRVRYSKASLPQFMEWKQMGQGEYVLGLEPGNCVPEGQVSNREKGLLKYLAPGEKVCSRVELVLDETE
ncbi:MAG: aldose 1-epimerase family protein [Lentisphaeria bacterium]|nr:aldose 1-epimerase family protein [Lentisphaeria bacterium]